jgi:hypothetical protein
MLNAMRMCQLIKAADGRDSRPKTARSAAMTEATLKPTRYGLAMCDVTPRLGSSAAFGGLDGLRRVEPAGFGLAEGGDEARLFAQ